VNTSPSRKPITQFAFACEKPPRNRRRVAGTRTHSRQRPPIFVRAVRRRHRGAVRCAANRTVRRLRLQPRRRRCTATRSAASRSGPQADHRHPPRPAATASIRRSCRASRTPVLNCLTEHRGAACWMRLRSTWCRCCSGAASGSSAPWASARLLWSERSFRALVRSLTLGSRSGAPSRTGGSAQRIRRSVDNRDADLPLCASRGSAFAEPLEGQFVCTMWRGISSATVTKWYARWSTFRSIGAPP
jgi:hypothetical protein